MFVRTAEVGKHPEPGPLAWHRRGTGGKDALRLTGLQPAAR